ncbi:MAG: lysine biosynthesis protein LysW [Candidatus Dormibacteraceae bacterium]
MAQCPECEAAIDLEEDEVEEGQIVDCPECGVELEVVSIDPLELNAITDDEEDEEDEEW